MKIFLYASVCLLLLACSQKSSRSVQTRVKETTWQEIDLDQEDIKTIRITYHIFNMADGTGNFQKGQIDHSSFLKDKIREINDYFAHLKPHVPSHIASPKDAKIRIKLEEIYYWADDRAFNCSTVGSYTHDTLFKNYVTNNVEISDDIRSNTLHVLLPGKRPRKYGGRNLTGLGFITNALYFEGWFQVYEKSLWGDIQGNFSHELGHGMGLPHYESSYFPCYACDDPIHCPQEGCNNLMLTNGGGPSLTECQLKVAHFLLKNGPSGLDIFNRGARANELVVGYQSTID